jgi:hypothetical protein
MIEGIMAGLSWCFLASFSLILLFSKLWTSLLWQRLRFVIIKPFGVISNVNHVLSLDSPSREF